MFVAYCPMYYNNVNNTRWLLTKQILEKKTDISDTTIKILFIGDSRPNAGIDFNQIEHSWSFCVGGASPIENYYVLKKYLSQYPKPETVFVSISPRFMSNIFAFWDLAVRNDFFTEDEKNEIIKNHKTCQDTTLGNNVAMRFFLYKIKFIKYYHEDLRKNLIFFGKGKNINLKAYILNNRGARPHPNLQDSCSALNFETKMHNFSMPCLLDMYFRKILSTCEQNNIKCIFFAMPLNKASLQQIDNHMIREYKNYLQKIASDYPKAEISDSLYAYDNKYFGDESHLNAKGKEIFTKNFKKYFMQK